MVENASLESAGLDASNKSTVASTEEQWRGRIQPYTHSKSAMMRIASPEMCGFARNGGIFPLMVGNVSLGSAEVVACRKTVARPSLIMIRTASPEMVCGFSRKQRKFYKY
ncbi:hypothetical protein BaRGS_00020115 [Batillaria attramentaria]|uniref:Uncharacterized protein n=1 Tax=Batillaria attramentaria TaxID=370345 RepID=A0ABD0KNG9_9CAEN